MGWFPPSLAGWWLGQLTHLKGVHKSRISSAPDRDDFIHFWNQWDEVMIQDIQVKNLNENLNSTFLILSHIISSFLFIISYQLIVIDHRLEELFWRLIIVGNIGQNPDPGSAFCIIEFSFTRRS